MGTHSRYPPVGWRVELDDPQRRRPAIAAAHNQRLEGVEAASAPVAEYPCESSCGRFDVVNVEVEATGRAERDRIPPPAAEAVTPTCTWPHAVRLVIVVVHRWER
jgi:hypothetical protein